MLGSNTPLNFTAQEAARFTSARSVYDPGQTGWQSTLTNLRRPFLAAPTLTVPSFSNAPAMQPPPIPNKDAEHLRTLAICHYVVAGMAIFGLAFLALHYSIMSMVFKNPKLMEKSANDMPFTPAEFLGIFQWFYVLIAVWFVVGGVLTFLGGRFIHRRVNRTFSIVIAGINCLHFPFGTALGIFTLIVLTRDSVIRLYAVSQQSDAGGT